MKTLKTLFVTAGCMAVLFVSTHKSQAQRPDFSQMRQMRIDSMKDKLSITNDEEWKVIETSLNKVSEAQGEVMADLMGGFGGGGGRRRNNTNDTNNAGDNGGQNRRPGGRFGAPSPEIDDLSKAIEEKAPVSEIKEKLAKAREASAAKRAKLTAAQDELKKLLTARQEAVAVVNRFLD